MSDRRDYERSLDRRHRHDRSGRDRRRQFEAEIGRNPETPFPRHVGTAADKVRRLEATVRRLARQHHSGGIRPEDEDTADALLRHAAQPEVFVQPWEKLRGRCPGKSGVTIELMELFGTKWDWARHLGPQLLLTGSPLLNGRLLESMDMPSPEDFEELLNRNLDTFGPRPPALMATFRMRPAAPLLRRPIRKDTGGFRDIHVSEIWDAPLESALRTVAGPFLTVGLPGSVTAYRRGLGPSDAVARAVALAGAGGRHVWLSVDLEDAFGSVPHNRLRSLLERLIPCPGLVNSIMFFMRPERREGAATGKKARGLPQGSCLAPMLFNAYLAHYVLGPWERRHPDMPIIAYADDILILARSKSEARRAHAEFRRLALSAGFRLKPRKTRRVNMNRGSLTWLGHRISRRDGRYTVDVPDEKWTALTEKIRSCGRRNEPDRALSTALALLAYHGPAWESRRLRDAVSRLAGILDDAGFTLPPSADAERRSRLLGAASGARKRWLSRRPAATPAPEEAPGGGQHPPQEAKPDRGSSGGGTGKQKPAHTEARSRTGTNRTATESPGSLRLPGYEPGTEPAPDTQENCSGKPAYSAEERREAPPLRKTVSAAGDRPGRQNPASKPVSITPSWVGTRRPRARPRPLKQRHHSEGPPCRWHFRNSSANCTGTAALRARGPPCRACRFVSPSDSVLSDGPAR